MQAPAVKQPDEGVQERNGEPELGPRQMGMRPVARAIHRLNLRIAKRFNQVRQIGWFVLEVGILNDNDVAGGMSERRAYRRAFATIDGVMENAEARFGCRSGRVFEAR